MHRTEKGTEEGEIEGEEYQEDYFTYKLKGIVVHTGSADSGHYYSYAEGKNGKWVEFNDETVSYFDKKKIP